jgi:hypothetical protein
MSKINKNPKFEEVFSIFLFSDFFLDMKTIEAITVSPDSAVIRNTTMMPISKDEINKMEKEMQSQSKNASLLSGESLATAADNRIRRLVPYMTFYIPTNDFNYPINYQPMVTNKL